MGEPPCGSDYESDTWVLDGAGWTPGPAAPRGLTPCYFAAMAFHAGVGRVVLHGGGPYVDGRNDTWEYDGSAWVAGPVSPAMEPRLGAAMAYDAARGRAVLFGATRRVWRAP